MSSLSPTNEADQAADPVRANGCAPNGCTRREGWGPLCLDNCKYSGHHGGHDMVRCCSCAAWFHEKCISETEEFVPGIWACFTCRRMPSQVAELSQKVVSLIDTVNALTRALAIVSANHEETLLKTTAIHDKLLSENAELRKQIADNHQNTSSEQWKQFPKAHGTVVLGSSIIRDIDPNKLVATKCVCISGGLIKDVQTELDNFPPHCQLSRAVLVIGGNDCDNSGAGGDVTDILEQYKDLINTAKSIANSIAVSSVCPRNKSPEVTERISSLNAGLQALCSDLDVEYVNNNPSFYLQDGSLNDGYLLPDNVHLTQAATNRLVANLKLQLRQGEESAHSDHRRLSRAQQQPPTNTQDGYQDDDLMGVNLDDPFWKTVQSKHKRKGKNRPTTPISAHPQSRLNHPGPRVQSQRPVQHPTQQSAKSQTAPGVTRTAVIPTFTKQFTKRPAPLTSQRPLQRPTPLMEIDISKPHNFTPKPVYAPPHPTHSHDTVQTQCQLCLGWGHSAVTCKSKDATCYSCGKVGHFSRACLT